MDASSIRYATYFEPGTLPLVVIKNDHHGKTNLHTHEFIELVYIDHGVSLHSHEGETQILTTGDIFIIQPGEAHCYISSNNTGLYNCLFTREALAGLESALADLGELRWAAQDSRAEPLGRLHANMAERQEIVLLLEQIIWERLNRPLGWQLKCKLLLGDLLLFYARLASKQRSAPGEASPHFKQILKAVAYIETHFGQELLVEDIAREAGLSAGYLTRQFKQSLGSSPSEYARNFRMAKAAELLREESLSIAEIAEKLGFGDIALFSRQFKQVTGVSPTGFRKNS